MTYKPNFIKCADFCSEYNIRQNTVYAFKHYKLNYASKFHNDISSKTLYIDKGYFEARRAKENKIKNSMCDDFYEITEHFSQRKLAKIMTCDRDERFETKYNYLNYSMFASRNKSIINLYIAKEMIKTYRDFAKVKRAIKKVGYDEIALIEYLQNKRNK